MMQEKLGNTANGGGGNGKRYIPAGDCGTVAGSGIV